MRVFFWNFPLFIGTNEYFQVETGNQEDSDSDPDWPNPGGEFDTAVYSGTEWAGYASDDNLEVNEAEFRREAMEMIRRRIAEEAKD